ncbi:MAG: type II toxin-antitoxin system HicA family toxin [Treponema sp.]|nr:type II toxin-antitoxin system HicA family toxin [Treponema sp.]
MPLSGEQLLKLYRKAGWKVISQRGSHVKVGKNEQRETIPMHKELKKGLEQSLLKRLSEEGF